MFAEFFASKPSLRLNLVHTYQSQVELRPIVQHTAAKVTHIEGSSGLYAHADKPRDEIPFQQQQEISRIASSNCHLARREVPRLAGLMGEILTVPRFFDVVKVGSVPVAALLSNSLTILRAPIDGYTMVELHILCSLLRENTSVEVWDWNQLPQYTIQYLAGSPQPRSFSGRRNVLQPFIVESAAKSKRAQAAQRKLDKYTALDESYEAKRDLDDEDDDETDDEYYDGRSDEDRSIDDFDTDFRRMRVVRRMPPEIIEKASQLIADSRVPVTRCCFTATTSEDRRLSLTTPLLQLAPDWLVPMLADTLVRNQGLKEVWVEDLFTNAQLQQLDRELCERRAAHASNVGESEKSKRIHASTASSSGERVTFSALIVDAPRAKRMQRLCERIVHLPAVQQAIYDTTTAARPFQTIACHLSALFAQLLFQDDILPQTIRSVCPIPAYYAPFALTTSFGGSASATPAQPPSIEASSPKHPVAATLLNVIRSTFRPIIDDTLTMESGVSGQRVQWPSDLVDLVVAFL